MKYSEKNFKLAVCLAVIEGEGRILITRRNIQMKIFPQAWVLPGGHVDQGEALEEAVIREISEETGVHIIGRHTEEGIKYTYKGQQC